MEPMTLGSPTHSPSAGGSSPGAGGYLPPFLLGEISSPSTPHLRTNSLSPTKGRNLAFGSPMSPPQTSTPDQKGYRPSVSMHQQALYNQQQSIYPNMPTSPNMSYNKPNGPPIEDLFDSIKNNDQSLNNTNMFGENSFAGYNNSLLQNSYLQTNQNQSVYGGYNDSGRRESYAGPEEHWVTVFGFPPSTADTVLATLSNCATIVEKQYPTQGNWAHVRYATRAEKERALALNGRLISPGIMVGVVSCKEPPRQPSVSRNTTITSPERSTMAARPLCPTALPSTTAPQGSSGGIVSKTMEYLFGW